MWLWPSRIDERTVRSGARAEPLAPRGFRVTIAGDSAGAIQRLGVPSRIALVSVGLNCYALTANTDSAKTEPSDPGT